MEHRIKKLKDKLNEKNLEAAIVTSRANTLWFSGFTGSTSYFLAGLNKSYLIVDFRYTIQASQQVFNDIEVIEYQDSFFNTLNELIKKDGIKNIGFEGNVVSFQEYQDMKSKLTNAQNLINLEDTIEKLRIIKDQHEIDRLQQAVLLGDKVFDEILKFIKPGIKETDIAAELEYIMRKLGAKGPSFESIVAAGPRSAMCHGAASDYAIQNGDALVLDFGVIYRNYCSDMTRTIFIGEPKKELEQIYQIVKEAQQAVLDALKPGMSGYEADKIARDIIEKAGYGKNFGHGLGHGVGIQIHEAPRLSLKSKDILTDGMVFTIEPGIYVEGLGGVRIEDMVTFIDGKLRNFTTSTKEMVII
ncbi:MAG: aminopeptidase P family protein [Clostridiaceae bacterium]|nr:aminopeptidase P family protein [Clostridiaceae bacterium]